jgi:hypothetical protein
MGDRASTALNCAIRIDLWLSIGERVARGRPVSQIKTIFRILLAIVCSLQLTACAKTVQWEEEVPINAEETIWVKRTDTYVKGGEPGNPLKWTWGLDKRAYAFSWRGQAYTYEVKTKSGGPLLLHVFAADKSVAVVDSTWPTCAGYGEFRWANGAWRLQENVSKSLIGQRRNLMAFYSADAGDIPARVDKAFRQQADTAPNRGRKDLSLEESKIAINCSRSK